ncbi:MerR family transcriptional regulator [Streptomyces albipurpureus]|uniref:MerR family transcriptional regulator n=1 Tax=Streptomyces albipurpureus TaxID=2897419 RepID=A0ABT0UEQ8_9ACTN|nr:MerR family transcriptional regulator [Streptomyces sp. CWNU-1]MCM2387049.1 MerR family transcriptional regulator [Streptomyces sp. CWNU-1]
MLYHATGEGSGAQRLTTGATAERFGLATHVLRHWESVGLLSPGRDGGNRRRYGPGDLLRVSMIRRAKQAGLSLDAIRALCGAHDPVARRAVLAEEAQGTALQDRIGAGAAGADRLCAGLRPGRDHRVPPLPAGDRLTRDRRRPAEGRGSASRPSRRAVTRPVSAAARCC